MPALTRSLCAATAVALCLVQGAAAPATAAPRCTSGSAFLASVERPHLVDPADDAQGPGTLIAEAPLDLRSAWISAEDEGSPDYRVTLQVASLRDVAPRTVYYVEFSTDAAAQRPWLSATWTGTEWEFQTGTRAAQLFFVGSVYQPTARVLGEVDTARGLVSIEIPDTIIGPAEAASADFGPLLVSSNLSLDAPLTIATPEGSDLPGARAFADSFVNGEACTIDLRPPAPDADA